MVDIYPMSESDPSRDAEKLDGLVDGLTRAMRETQGELKALRKQREREPPRLWLSVVQIVAPIALFIAAAAFGFAWNLNTRMIRMEEGPPTVQSQILETLGDHESRLRAIEHVHREVGGNNGNGS